MPNSNNDPLVRAWRRAQRFGSAIPTVILAGALGAAVAGWPASRRRWVQRILS